MTTWGLADAHQEVVDAVRAVMEETEGPILTAGRTVSLVLERAQATLRETEDLASHDAAGRSELSRLLLAQGEATRNSLQAFVGGLQGVAGVTTQATALMNTIGSAAMSFAQVVRMGDFLSLYAKMELARLPPETSESNPFSEEFRSLTRDIRELSGQLGRFSAAMIATLPEIDRLVHELVVESRSVASQVETQSQRVGDLADALDQSLSVLSRIGEERLPSIVERAQKALSSLQFYDPLMQALQSLDGLMADLRSVASGDGTTVATLRYTPPLGDLERGKGWDDQPSTTKEPVADAGKVMIL